MHQRIAHMQDALQCGKAGGQRQDVGHEFRQMHYQQNSHDEHAFGAADPTNRTLDAQRLCAGAHVTRKAAAEQRENDRSNRQVGPFASQIDRDSRECCGFADPVERGIEECADLAERAGFARQRAVDTVGHAARGENPRTQRQPSFGKQRC